jgi:hypothetical protein
MMKEEHAEDVQPKNRQVSKDTDKEHSDRK